MTAPTSMVSMVSFIWWSIAPGPQYRTHCWQSQHPAQFRHRCASRTTCSFVNPWSTSVNVFTRSSIVSNTGCSRFCGIRIASFGIWAVFCSSFSRPKSISSLLKNRSMDSAAICPAPIASTADAGPVTASPPAKTPSWDVCNVRGWAWMNPGSDTAILFSSISFVSSSWPMAKIV